MWSPINIVLYAVVFGTVIFETQTDDDAAAKAAEMMAKYTEAEKLSSDTFATFVNMFYKCVQSSIPDQKFILDDLQSYVNHPARTTIGFAPKFTSNRKFFANMITTTAFKEMLAKDEDEMRKAFIKKMRFCDESVMDAEFLKEFYDREIDQNRM